MGLLTPIVIMLTQQTLKQFFDLSDDGRLVRKTNAGLAKKGTSSSCKDKDGYKVIGFKGRQHRVHRLVWLYVYGKFPDGPIDHINRIKDDNRPENLRLATPSQNRQNISMQSNNKSGIKGVWLHAQTKKWCASIVANKKSKHLGSFLTKEEAGAAYVAAAKVLHDCNCV
jgi:hypothetical protein